MVEPDPGRPPPEAHAGDESAADRDALARLGVVFVIAGLGLIAYAVAGLLHTLPPTYGHTMEILASSAIGFVLLGTGAIYMRVARGALEPVVTDEGIEVAMRDGPGPGGTVPWDEVDSLCVRPWRMSPRLKDPRFFEVGITMKPEHAREPRVAVVYLRQRVAFEERLRDSLAGRFISS